MTSTRTPHDHLVSATALLDRARVAQEVRRAVQGLSEIGRAAAAAGWAFDQPEEAELRLLAVDNSDLLGWAALSLGDKLYDDDPDGHTDALFARSGFQVLLDLGLWPEWPVDDFHLAALDEEINDAWQEGRLKSPARPANLPAHHTWWYPPPS